MLNDWEIVFENLKDQLKDLENKINEQQKIIDQLYEIAPKEYLLVHDYAILGTFYCQENAENFIKESLSTSNKFKRNSVLYGKDIRKVKIVEVVRGCSYNI